MRFDWFAKRDFIPSVVVIISLTIHILKQTQIQWWWLFIIILGQSIRIYTRMWIGDFTRYRTMSVKKIITKGPFLLSRNPLYVSNLLVSFSWLQLIGVGLIEFVTIMSLLFWNWHQVVKVEELYLQEKFSGEYLDYQKRVSRWISLGNFPEFFQSLGGSNGVQIDQQNSLSNRLKSTIYADRWTWFWQYTSLTLVWALSCW